MQSQGIAMKSGYIWIKQIYMCANLYVCIHGKTHKYSRARTQMKTRALHTGYTKKDTHARAHAYTLARIHTCTHTLKPTSTNACTQARTHTRAHVRTHILTRMNLISGSCTNMTHTHTHIILISHTRTHKYMHINFISRSRLRTAYVCVYMYIPKIYDFSRC